MHTEVFVICDAATDYNGKLNILGAYDAILGTSIPVKSQPLVFAIRIRFTSEEAGERACDIHAIDYDGRPILPMFSAKVNVLAPANRDSFAVNLILTVNNVSFPRAGDYRIDLLIDGKVRGSLPLHVSVAS